MMRSSLAVGLTCLLWASSAVAGSETMFAQTSHDFGPVPRGGVLTHHYRFTNNTKNTVHIAGVRVSCGCVTATAQHSDVAPGQSSSILAQMDTRRFVGHKSVTIFVTLDRPRWEEVHLTITALGRDDINLEPDSFQVGTIRKGVGGNAKTTVVLRNPQWQVTGVKPESSFVSVASKAVQRNAGEMAYELEARVDPELPVGRWVTDVWLNTNNPGAPRIRVPLNVEVLPALTISPGDVALGAMKVGDPVERKITVRGSKPFKITEIQGTDANLLAKPAFDDARPVHVLTVKFDPKDEGELKRTLKIVTDLPTDGTAELSVKANVSKKD